MFGKSTDDVAATLRAMHDRARIECRYDRNQIVEKMAGWLANDRRFDGMQGLSDHKRIFMKQNPLLLKSEIAPLAAGVEARACVRDWQ